MAENLGNSTVESLVRHSAARTAGMRDNQKVVMKVSMMVDEMAAVTAVLLVE